MTRTRWSRGRIATGTAGLAAILGVGAYLVTDNVVNNEQNTAGQEVRQIAPVATDPATPAATDASPTPSAQPSSAGSSSPVPTADASGSPLPSEVVEEIREARRKMAEDGVPIKPPVVPKAAAAAAPPVEMTTKGSLKEGGIIRTLTARGDLTGQRELAYVAGGVKEYRGVSCSQTFQFSTNPKPEKKDNLVMCWRTSAKKSVAVMVVDPKGKPSKDKAVDAIEKNWRSMG
ncbi:hypothetical protein [Actinoplanes sp. GCM10030250]|uniref:hypothetical protein n=1 Tax=Actinoplanes sp. GCM10030250 TaxID=3273376 RepID=UPI003612A4EF